MGTFWSKIPVKKLLQFSKSVELNSIGFSFKSMMEPRYNIEMYSLSVTEHDYFDEISNSFGGPALICDQLGEVLFSSDQCPYRENFLGADQLAEAALGADVTTLKDGESITYTIYKLMNPLQNYENQLFIVVFKTC